MHATTVTTPHHVDTFDALSPAAFSTEAERPFTVMIDLRETDERVAEGSIPGAVHVPRGLLEFRADPMCADHDPRLDPRCRILLHCADGRRSALAATTLHELGFHDVAVLDGGLVTWLDEGRPVVGRVDSPY